MSYRSNLPQVLAALEHGSNCALENIGQQLLAEAVRRAPLDRGPLRESGAAVVNGEVIARGDASGAVAYSGNAGREVQDGVSVLVVGFGGGDVDYAIRQHEDLSFRHDVGQAKYLEAPYLEQRSDYREEMQKVIRNELRR